MISLGCLSLSNFEGKQVNVPTLSHKKRPTLTPTTGGCLLILIKPSRSPSEVPPFSSTQLSYSLVKKYHNIILSYIIHILIDLFSQPAPSSFCATAVWLQSLIGTLQLACWVISPGQPFLQHIINLSERTFTCGTFFLSTGMVSTSFSPLTLKPPQTSTSILMLLGG